MEVGTTEEAAAVVVIPGERESLDQGAKVGEVGVWESGWLRDQALLTGARQREVILQTWPHVTQGSV